MKVLYAPHKEVLQQNYTMQKWLDTAFRMCNGNKRSNRQDQGIVKCFFFPNCFNL